MSLDGRSSEALAADLCDPDFDVRARSLAELVRRGRSATGALLRALEGPGEQRVQVVRALAEIADPEAVDALLRATEDPEERVRAYAAQGLARLGHARARDALVRAIDDFPDVLRPPFTPAVDALIEMGPPALPSVGPLLDAPSASTRRRAFLVVRQVLAARPEGTDWDELVRTLGAYDPDAEDGERADIARRWRAWIEETFSGD